jgi:uncharacterized membrane protein
MEQFINYIFIISLTLLFILISGFLAGTAGIISALLISVCIYIYKRVKNKINLPPFNEVKENKNNTLYRYA